MPIFSLVHPTARPQVAPITMRKWLDAATHPQHIEYIIGIEEGWGFPRNWSCEPAKIAYSTAPRCLVNNTNNAAKLATGQILINVSDDFLPPPKWDAALVRKMCDADVTLTGDFVIHVNDGSQSAPNLMTLPICSRTRYKRLGYLLYPGYDGLFSDSEFTEHARLDGCVVDALDLEFKHYHPFFGYGEMDEVYKHENRSEAYSIGRDLYDSRKALNFPPLGARC